MTKARPPIRERDIEAYLVRRVKAAGGEVRKLKWIGRRGAPDRVVFLNGKVMFVEVKAPGKELAPHQQRELKRLWEAGFTCAGYVSTFAEVDELVELLIF